MAVRTLPQGTTARRVAAVRRSPRAAAISRTARLFAKDFAILVAVIGVYFLLRGVAPTRIEASVATTNVLIDIERSLGLFWEPQVQEWSIKSDVVKEFANLVYAYLHFPVLAAVGAVLWFRRRADFTFVRNVMFLSMLIGLVFYYALPAAPPRLMEMHGYDLGFVDTIFATETSVQYAQPSLILNEYAAIPSFHFGWILLAQLAVFRHTGNRAARGSALTLTVVMTWAIVASANHLFIDMVLGGAVILFAWWAAARLARRGNGATTAAISTFQAEQRRAA
jgi:hypothetical protein